MRSPSSTPVTDAVILAAGNGDRFHTPDRQSKLLHPINGRPLILQTLETAVAAGMLRLHVVLGYAADGVRDLIERHRPPGITIRFAFNPDWHLENGVSALASRELAGNRRFALLMGDHLFEPDVLRRTVAYPVGADESVLAIDTNPADPAVADEATRVRLDRDFIVRIGKHLEPWDALDTGVFVFTPELYTALEAAQAAGETTLSAGVQRLADRRRIRGVTIGDAAWWDVDTTADLPRAEAMIAGAGRAI